MTDFVPRHFRAHKLSVFGDWHGDLPFALAALAAAHEHAQSELFLHVGDFGFWPAPAPTQAHEEADFPQYLDELESYLASIDKMLLFIDGNHEHHLELNALPLDEHGLRPVREHIVHVPRGALFLVNDKRFVGLGGAYSIDRPFRIKDYSWFTEEIITYDDVLRASAHGHAHVLLTHEAPEAPWLSSSLSAVGHVISSEQRRFVDDVRRALNPRILVHGHHHRFYRDRRGVTTVVGLGCDVWPLEADALQHNVVHVAVDEL